MFWVVAEAPVVQTSGTFWVCLHVCGSSPCQTFRHGTPGFLSRVISAQSSLGSVSSHGCKTLQCHLSGFHNFGASSRPMALCQVGFWGAGERWAFLGFIPCLLCF